jgi:hypothetical protein
MQLDHSKQQNCPSLLPHGEDLEEDFGEDLGGTSMLATKVDWPNARAMIRETIQNNRTALLSYPMKRNWRKILGKKRISLLAASVDWPNARAMIRVALNPKTLGYPLPCLNITHAS